MGLLKAQWDILTSRFEVFFAEHPKDVHGCLKVLDEVRRTELNRVAGASAADSHALAEVSAGLRLVACRDRRSGAIMGCMRVTPATAAMDHPLSRAEYRLDLMPRDLMRQTVILTRLCILRSHRATAASYVLFSKAFSTLMDEGMVTALLACEPGLLPMYQRLGGRPLGPLHKAAAGGFRIPVVCIPDQAHLRKIRSPLARVLSRVDPAQVEPFRRWYAALEPGLQAAHLGFRAHLSHEDQDPVLQGLTAGMGPRGVRGLFTNALVLTSRQGDVLLEEGDGGRFLCVVRSGEVEAQRGGRTVALVGPGGVLGEVAMTLEGYRSARVVVASPQAELVLLSAAGPGRIRNPADQAAFWRNVARCLAVRLQRAVQANAVQAAQQEVVVARTPARTESRPHDGSSAPLGP